MSAFAFHDRVRVVSCARNGISDAEGVVTGHGPKGWVRVRVCVANKLVSDFYLETEIELVKLSPRRARALARSRR